MKEDKIAALYDVRLDPAMKTISTFNCDKTRATKTTHKPNSPHSRTFLTIKPLCSLLSNSWLIHTS